MPDWFFFVAGSVAVITTFGVICTIMCMHWRPPQLAASFISCRCQQPLKSTLGLLLSAKSATASLARHRPAAVIFAPWRLLRVAEQIPTGDMVVVADLGADHCGRASTRRRWSGNYRYSYIGLINRPSCSVLNRQAIFWLAYLVAMNTEKRREAFLLTLGVTSIAFSRIAVIVLLLSWPSVSWRLVDAAANSHWNPLTACWSAPAWQPD